MTNTLAMRRIRTTTTETVMPCEQALVPRAIIDKAMDWRLA